MLLDRRRRIATAILRAFGRSVLWVSDIQLHVENEERLTMPGGAILAPNHSSTIDVFLFTGLMPSGATALAKSTFKYYPFIGQGAWLLGLLFIKRGNSDKARATIAKAAQRIREGEMKVLISPEGTRSKDGTLAPFKTGAFHLAMQAGVPIIPIVVHGGHDLQPRGMWAPQRGDLYVRVLEPIAVDHLNGEDVRREVDRMRSLMQETLDEMRRAHPRPLRP